MPSALTAPVQDGTITALEPFALRCARQFGALLHMRDASLNADIPDEVPMDSYYAEDLAKSQARYDAALGRTVEAWREEYDRATADREAEHVKYTARQAAEKARYVAMLGKVERWAPPTAEHKNLREFMIKQLQESIAFDCPDYPRVPQVPFEQFIAQQLEVLKHSVVYAQQQLSKTTALHRENTEWVRALRASVKGL